MLINCYGEKLSRPKRLPRFVSGVEARLNATNPALNPHAGGVLRTWSAATEMKYVMTRGLG